MHARYAAYALAAALGLLAGCSGQRPLHMVKADAQRHAQYARYEQAQADYEYYLERRPDAVEVRAELARVYLALNQPGKAMQQMQIATDVMPLNDEFLDLQAEAIYQAGDRDALISTLSRLASERQRPIDYLRLGTYQARLGNADEAEHALLLAARMDGGRSLRYQKALADFYGELGDSQRQLGRLRNCLYLAPEDAVLHAEIRGLGEVPGPAFARPPVEMRADAGGGN